MRILYRLTFLLLTFLSGLTGYAQVSLSGLNSVHTQNFNSLLATGTANEVTSLPTGWLFIETGTNANTTYAAGTGSLNTGNTYSFGLDADRALGGLQSGSLVPILGAQFQNNTGSLITSLQITYTGEQWRLGATGRGADRLDFQYSLDAASLNSGSWIHTDELDFSSPVTTGTIGAINGNISANRATITYTITGLTLAPGASIWMRWLDFNVTSSDDGLAIDDFSITPQGSPVNEPSITLKPGSLSFGDINLGNSDTLSYQVVGKNLTESILVAAGSVGFEISTDGISFPAFLMLPPEGGKIIVRFTPGANGTIIESVSHVSGATRSSLVVSGNGYDPAANIITIANARTKSAGTKVTVTGRVTSANQLGSPSYVQDVTGGIPVFDFNFSNAVAIGDSVVVTGPIGVFNNQVQISGSGIFHSIINVPQRVLAPKNIQLSELAANEGMLVTVQQVELVNKSFVFYPQSTEKISADGTSADLRIDGDTNIPGLTKPQGLVDITGVVGRFRTTAQLMPRFQSDLPGTAEPSTPSDSIPKSETFDVLDWNIEFFGATIESYGTEYGPADEAKQFQNVKTVIESQQADVISIQEVSDESLFQQLVNMMPNYSYVCSDRYSYSFDTTDTSFPPQKVCFIYDTTTVKVLSARPLFEQLYDSARNVDGSLLPSYPSGSASSFWSSGRLPFMLSAIVTINGVSKKINFINIHAKSGASAADRLRRMYDGQVLKDSLDTHYANENFIILGDYNDDLDQSIVVGQTSSYKNFVDDSARYAPITKVLSESGARSTVGFSDMIDHQIISNELMSEYIQGSAKVITPFRMIADYANTTSDHLAITSRYTFHAPVVSFASSDSIIVDETSVTLNIDIKLSESMPIAKTILVSINTDATYGSDYTTTPALVNGQLSLDVAAETDSISFQVSILNDSIDEVNETLFFTLLAQEGIEVNEIPVHVTIADNDVPVLSWTTTDFSIEEGAAAHALTLSLSQAPAVDHTATISLTNANTTFYSLDYTTSPEGSAGNITIVIPAGSTEASISFTALADVDKEKHLIETVAFNISSVSEGLAIGANHSLTATIADVKKVKATFVVEPNPSHGVVRLAEIELDSAFEGAVLVTLRKMNGEVIYTGSGTPTEVSEAMSNVLQGNRNGVYLLTLIVDGEISVIRILKN